MLTREVKKYQKASNIEKKSTIVQLELISSSRNDLRTGGLPSSYYLQTFFIEVARLGNDIGNRNHLFD